MPCGLTATAAAAMQCLGRRQCLLLLRSWEAAVRSLAMCARAAALGAPGSGQALHSSSRSRQHHRHRSLLEWLVVWQATHKVQQQLLLQQQLLVMQGCSLKQLCLSLFQQLRCLFQQLRKQQLQLQLLVRELILPAV